MTVPPTPTAGQTHDVVLGDRGLLLVPGSLRKFDITPYTTQARTENPRYQDFSQQFVSVIESWHHGRGALELEDPASFFDSSLVDTRIRGQAILAPARNVSTKAAAASVNGNPVKFDLFTTSATLWMVTGGTSRDAFTWNNTDSVWAPETAGMTVDPTDFVEFLGKVYIGQGSGTNARTNQTGSWGTGTSAFVAEFFAKLNNVLYWSDWLNGLYFAIASPTAAAANRLGPIYVGDDNTKIRSLRIWQNRIYIGKDDGLYTLDNGVVQKLLDFSFARDTNNFRWMKDWKGALYFPVLNGLYRLVGGTTLQAVGPNRGAAGLVELGNIALERNQTTFKSLAAGKVGKVVDIVPTENWLYAVIDGVAGTSQIVCWSGEGSWHQITEGAAANKRIRAAFYTGSIATSGVLLLPRLWYGYDVDPYNIILPDGTEDPTEYTRSEE